MFQNKIVVFIIMMIMMFSTSVNVQNWFNPQVTLMAGYSLIQNKKNIKSGSFDISNRNFNFGFSITNNFYLSGDYFLNSGIQYYNYQTKTEGLNLFSDRLDYPRPFTWKRGYDCVTIPIRLGKDFYKSGNLKGEVFIGVSAGVLMTSYEKVDLVYMLAKNVNNDDMIELNSFGKSELPNSFILSGDIGAMYYPLKSIPNLGIGLLYTVQMNKTSFQNTFQGIATNITKGASYSYDMLLRQQFSNMSFLISYNLSKKKQN